MNSESSEQSLDDRLKAIGRLERRRLLLRLATTDRRIDPCIDFSGAKRPTSELNPLVTMHHLHLPMLEEHDFIRWNRETDRVTKGPRFDELEPFLELLQDLRRDSLTG